MKNANLVQFPDLFYLAANGTPTRVKGPPPDNTFFNEGVSGVLARGTTPVAKNGGVWAPDLQLRMHDANTFISNNTPKTIDGNVVTSFMLIQTPITTPN